ncbi:sugar transferase [Vibrio cholerae]|nr:sugar transferase [Vibrio cholerae]
MKYSNFKRTFDVIFSVFALVFLSPIIIIVSFFVFLNLGRPIIFVQRRPGYGGIIFKMYKFRTMLNSNSNNALDNVKTDALRLTKFGRWLRASSLDELPGLWNVLKGDMSLVGPRPLLPEYLSLYSSEQARRHEVKPGLTGWAQVNGRNSITWEEKLKLDIWYVDNISFFLDLKILIKTFFLVLKRADITSPERDTTDPFTGEKK